MAYENIFNTMFKLLVAISIGYVLNKKNVLNEHVNKSISSLIINVTCPALIIYSVCKQEAVNSEVLKLLGFGGLIYLVLPILSMLIIRMLRVKKSSRGVYELLLIFANVSFMGFPVVQAVYGEKAVFFINILNMPFNLLIFTYGIWLIQRNSHTKLKLDYKNFVSIGVISSVISLFIYFLQIPMPSFLTEALGFIGGITTPLSMIAIGGIIADFSIREIASEKKMILLSIVKLAIFPFIGYFAAKIIFQDPTLVGVITLSLGMPSGALCVMMCQKHGADAKVASIGVFMTTMLSLLTIPVILMLLS